ncbi:MAG: amino acid ABC transporter substrate-binding protein [Bacillaceae bacterium]
MKKLMLFVSSLLLSTSVLVGCSGKSESTPKKESKDMLTTIKETGVLKVGTEGTYPPFTFHDKSGKLTGFDVEIVEEIAKRLNVKVEFVETQWDSLFAGLDAKRFDMIANQVGIREDRIAKYDFSKAYISSPAALVTLKGNKNINSFKDLKGKKTAQSLTSNYADQAKSLGAEIVGVEGLSQAIGLLKSNRAEATINDRLSILDYLKTSGDKEIQIVEIANEKAESGLLFRKNSGAIVEEVNKALDAMVKDGTYAKISEKWFGVDVSK